MAVTAPSAPGHPHLLDNLHGPLQIREHSRTDYSGVDSDVTLNLIQLLLRGAREENFGRVTDRV